MFCSWGYIMKSDADHSEPICNFHEYCNISILRVMALDVNRRCFEWLKLPFFVFSAVILLSCQSICEFGSELTLSIVHKCYRSIPKRLGDFP